MNLRQQTLDAASRNIGRLKAAIERVKATDADRLRDEYNRLVSGLQVFLPLKLMLLACEQQAPGACHACHIWALVGVPWWAFWSA